MRRARFSFAQSILLLFILAFPDAGHAGMRFLTMLELAEQSDVVMVGKVADVGKDAASIEVDEVLSGNWKRSR